MFRLFASGTRPSKTSAACRSIGGRSLTLAVLILAVSASSVLAQQPRVGLGTTDSFAVLSGSAVTNTGPSVINGNLGVSPGSAISGFPPGIVNGAVHATNGVAGQAKSDLVTAYNDAAGRTPVVNVSGDLGGRTLTAGVYKASSSIGLTGPLTLNAQGNPDAVFIFQVGSGLTTATDSSVRLLNGAQACNVYWQVGSSATLGTRTAFKGTIMALTSISLNNGVVVDGRLLARNGAVTLINDTITRSQCAPGSDGGSGDGPGGSDGGSDGGPGSGPGDGPGSDRRAPRVRLFRVPGGRPTGPGVRLPPSSNVCTDRAFTARVRIRDGAGIRRVKVYLDGALIRRTSLSRFTIRISVRGLRVGPHRIKVIALDRAGNRSVTRRRFGRCALALPAPRFTG
jgi:Ice-binding-like